MTGNSASNRELQIIGTQSGSEAEAEAEAEYFGRRPIEVGDSRMPAYGKLPTCVPLPVHKVECFRRLRGRVLERRSRRYIKYPASCETPAIIHHQPLREAA